MYRPPCPTALLLPHRPPHRLPVYAQDIILFQFKVYKRSGLTEDGTYLPKSLHPR